MTLPNFEFIDEKDAPPPPGRRKSRSPAYPGIDLKMAIEKSRLFEAKEHKNAAPVAVALKHMGYSEKSGAGTVALSSLLKFGLMSEEGAAAARRVRLTDSGFRVAVDTREASPERDALIREAALAPPIHADVWKHYQNGLPSDDTLLVELKVDRGFSEVGAKEFIREIRATMAFAGVEEGDSLSGNTDDEGEDGDPFMPATDLENPPTQSGGKQKINNESQSRVVQIPLAPGRWAALQLPQPITAAEWAQMEAILKAMRAGLVESTE